MTKKKTYICPESDFRRIVVGRVVCASDIIDKFESGQNEEVIENDFIW